MACPFQHSPSSLTSRSTHVLYRSLRHAGSRASNPPGLYSSYCRFSTGSSKLAKGRGVSKKTRNPLSYNSPKPAAVAPSEYESTAQALAKKQSPTLLYQSGSHLGYILGCYFAGGGLIGMGVFNSLSANMVPEGDYTDKGKILPTWLPYFVHTGSLFMVAVGAWICLRPQNMVRVIKSIPSTGSGARSLVLQLERSPSMPFVTPKVIKVSPKEITLSQPMWQGTKEQIEREVQAIQKARDRANAFSRTRGGILTLPFRQAEFYMKRGFTAVKKAFTNNGLLQLHVKGHNIPWKLEHRDAWALDEGQALDKLVTIKAV